MEVDSSPKNDGKMQPIAMTSCLIIDIFICLLSLALMFLVATQASVPEFSVLYPYSLLDEVKIAIVIQIVATAVSFVASALILMFEFVLVRHAWKKIQTSGYTKCCFYV